jgi:sugar phosphate isomerase/epimerase
MTDPRRRGTRDLTLGFLTLGAQAAPLDVLAAAAHAGFGAAGLRVSGRHPGDPWPSVRGTGELERIAAQAAAAGIRVSSISGYYMSERASREHLLANVDAASRVGAPLIAQGCFDPDLSRVTFLLRDYARAAADRGLRIALEFMPMSSIRTIAQAQDIIAASSATNVGLLVDALHLARSGAIAADLAALDPAVIHLTQLCDAPAHRAPDVSLFDEAMAGRLYPGDGGLDLESLVRALPADAEIELETPVVTDADRPGPERAQRTAQKAEAFFRSRFGSLSAAGR